MKGWRAQQMARGRQECTIAPPERLVRGFLANEYPLELGAFTCRLVDAVANC